MVQTAHVNGIEMDYCSFGTGEKAFVILPGLSIKPVAPMEEMLKTAFGAFAEEFTVYVFDRRTNIPDECTLEGMADDTAEVMRALGLSHAGMFGASQGGIIARLLAARHPELVDRLILGSTCAKVNIYFRGIVERWVALAKTGDGYELNRVITETIYSDRILDAYRDTLLAAGEGITREELERFINVASSILRYDPDKGPHKINCPALVLGSYGDKVTTPEGALELAEEIGCEYYLYEDTYGHAVYDEAPDFRDRMLAFLLEKRG